MTNPDRKTPTVTRQEPDERNRGKLRAKDSRRDAVTASIGVFLFSSQNGREDENLQVEQQRPVLE